MKFGSAAFRPSFSPNRWLAWLEGTTLLYLSLPVVIWLFGWLHLWLAGALTLALIPALWLALRETKEHFRSERAPAYPPIPLLPWIAGLLLAGLWGVYSGAGGFGPTNSDWDKHFAILRDLTEAQWPVVYDRGGERTPLVYYFSYYLPSVFVGKHWGWWWECFSLNAWTALGCALAAAWFSLIVGRRPFLGIVLFIFANGLDFLGDRLQSGIGNKSGTEHIDWWAGFYFLNMPGHSSQLMWAPQHSLAAWCATGMFAYELSGGRKLSHAGLIAVLASFWSPFTAIGMTPFAVVAACRGRFRDILSLPNLVAIPLLGANFFFLLSNSSSNPRGFIWIADDLRQVWPQFCLFILFEWGIFALFAREIRRSSEPNYRWFFWTALATLAVLPFYKYGLFNDWCMRATIPALFLFWAGVARSLLTPPFDTENRVLFLLVVIGAFGAFVECARQLVPMKSEPPAQSTHHHVTEIDAYFVPQYMGSEKRFFFQYLAPQSETFQTPNAEQKKP